MRHYGFHAALNALVVEVRPDGWNIREPVKIAHAAGQRILYWPRLLGTIFYKIGVFLV